jgi:chromate reductase
MRNVVLISGSLREESWNTKILAAFSSAMPEGVHADWIDIAWPLFNEDLETESFPESVRAAKEKIAAAEAVIIATPEYNRSTPGVLKNALDWLSRPYGENSFAGKTVLVTSASLGAVSGACAYYNVVQVLTHLSADILHDTEFMVGHAADKFDDRGELIDEDTKRFITDAVQKLLS